MDSTVQKYITEYYTVMGKVPIIVDSLSSLLKMFFTNHNNVLITDNKILRGIGKIKRLERSHISEVDNKAIQFFALQDAFNLLYQKGVPVYFYNRIGIKKSGYQYSDKEQHRMKDELSFPYLYQNLDKYEDDLKDIFGELYSKEYVQEIGKIPQVIKVGNTYQHEDYHSDYINVENGKRVTLNQPSTFTRTIHVYGRCGAFGYAVEDKDSLPSLLQKQLLEKGVTDIRVINHGLWGGVDEYLDHNFLQDAMGMTSRDIVLFYRMHFNKNLLQEFERRGVRYKEITDEWHEKKNEKVTFYDRPGHMNAEGYKLISKIICEDLIKTGFSCGYYDQSVGQVTAEHLNYYLKSRTENDFDREVNEYIEGIKKEYPIETSMVSNGAIVMNCNPFTFGHLYLIETAVKQVDRLYIFVVEEDKSFFKFKDRFDMVKRGVEGISNVVVVPSGKFIISAYTFPEYFMKDYVKEKNFDVSTDVETFCKYIAPPLNIKIRFAGEEPFDPITKNYNENMARILPEHGMEFIEIPRYAIDHQRVINATRVRELLKIKDYDELREYVPQSTYDVLMKKYIE